MMEIKTVGVVGAGTMGNGIAHVFAKSADAVHMPR
jgi:3-hydroxyacyl-CoA dehydrogenase